MLAGIVLFLIFVLVPVLVFVFVLVLQFRWGWYPLQYLYFLRVPVGMALALIFLFFGAVRFEWDRWPSEWEAGPFQNLFLLDWFGLCIAASIAVLAAWAIAHAMRWLYANTPNRLLLTLKGCRQANEGHERIPNVIVPDGRLGVRHLGYALPALPLIGWTVFLSVRASQVEIAAALLAALIGILIPFLLRFCVVSGGNRPHRPTAGDSPSGRPQWELCLTWLIGPPSVRDDSVDAVKKVDETSIATTWRNLWLYGALTLIIYVIGWFTLRPDWGPEAVLRRVPAIAYLLMLLILLTWVLSFFSYWLDKYRVPAEVAFLAWGWAMYGIFGTDFEYELAQGACVALRAEQRGADDLTPNGYVAQWTKRRPGRDVIVVATSGGGIKASYWTAKVLTELQTRFADFAPSIALVSSTSGGSLGALYYIVGFRLDADGVTPPDPETVRRTAGHSSLGAMSWGLIYPDFLRFLFPPLAMGKDRGWAIQQQWERQFDEGTTPRLAEWRRDAVKGWRPAVIFNATIVETGERLLISPLDLHARCRDCDPAEGWRAQSFGDLYPGADVTMATAARLSATFPYVTPVSRPRLKSDCRWKGYHVADGGYYDNFGVMSAVEFLRDVRGQLRGRRVLLLQIRSSPPKRQEPEAGRGWWNELLAPLATLTAVQTSSQIARNDLEIAMLRDLWGKGFETVVFTLGTESPLSWHLSQGERRDIDAHWERCHRDDPERVGRVAAFLNAAFPRPDPQPQQPDPNCLRSRGMLPQRAGG